MTLVNLRSGTGAASPWVNLLTSDLSSVGGGDGWLFYYLASPAQQLSSSTTSFLGQGDAAWVNDQYARTGGHGTNDTVDWEQLKIEGPPNTSFTLDVFSSVNNSGRVTECRLDGGASQSIQNYDTANSLPNTSEILTFQGTTDENGGALFEYRADATSTGFAYVNALRLTPVESSSITLTNPPQLGATLSFTYANYAGIPVGPMAFDQGARSLPDEAVTITDNGDGSGSGVTDTALPGLPANGESVTPFPLIGENITITLPDPGA